ncbi:hypothetical protein ACV3QO_06315 [Clostridium perfringens]
MRLEENNYKKYELKVSERDALNVKFENHYTEQEINIILIEIRNAIKYVFGERYNYPNINIKVVDELKINGYTINGVYNPNTLKLSIVTKNIGTIFKLRNIICHELVHVKFAFDNLSRVMRIISGDISLYYVNEFWACKISREYSNDIKDANIFKNLNLDYELKVWETSNIENKKMFATSVCSCILENDEIDNVLENNKKYFELKRKIEEIGFNPTENDLEMLEKELLKLNLI